jgi:3',5'-cyclic AMP phosphodiesterase CpdA
MRIVHVSDLHHQLDWRRRSWASSGWRGIPGRLELHAFGRWDRFEFAERTWNGILEDIEVLSADHVILTGDLTAMGDENELRAMEHSLKHLTKAGRVTFIPGNHDRYTDASAARRFERVFAAELTSSMPEYADARGYPFVKLLGADVAFIGLDSTRVPAWFQYFVGRIGAAQLTALKRILDDPRLAGRKVHVLAHHGPLAPDGRREWRESALIDAPALLKTLKDRSVMFHHGHSHVRSWHRGHEAHPHLFGAGSSTEPGGEGYWLLDVDDHETLEATNLKPGRQLVR